MFNQEVVLRRFEEKDINNKVKWINDSKNNKFLHYDLPLEYDKTLNWYSNNKNRTDRYDAVIEYEGKPVGIIGLLGIDNKNKKAEYYITMGENEFKGKGIAYKASQELLKYAFNELNLNKVFLYTEVENIPAQGLFNKLGFQKEGTLRDDLIINNQKKDRYIYGIFKDEWNGKI